MDWKKIAPWNWFKDEELPLSPASAAGHRLTPSTLEREVSRILDAAFRTAPDVSRGSALLRPNIDITEGRKAYTVCAELPGVDLDDKAFRSRRQPEWPW